jgi:hypothetical protein
VAEVGRVDAGGEEKVLRNFSSHSVLNGRSAQPGL